MSDNNVQTVKVQTDTTLVGILVASFIFIISLAWNDAFKSFFSTSTPWLKKYGPWAYAGTITVIGFISIQFVSNNKYVNKLQASVEKKEEEIRSSVEQFY
jgi:hypothetical protein